MTFEIISSFPSSPKDIPPSRASERAGSLRLSADSPSSPSPSVATRSASAAVTELHSASEDRLGKREECREKNQRKRLNINTAINIPISKRGTSTTATTTCELISRRRRGGGGQFLPDSGASAPSPCREQSVTRKSTFRLHYYSHRVKRETQSK